MTGFIAIRTGVAGDRRTIRSIERRCFGWVRLLFGYWRRVGGKQTLSWLAEVDGSPVGYVIVFPLKLEAKPLPYICGLAVLSEHRQRGLGTALAEAAMNSVGACWLHVRPTNIAAVRLYETVGFKPRKRIRHFYSNGDDTLVMQYAP